mmetsp:Transcript_32703/g.104794  ORF Transcript_32703/g.104794 Transcript_32703/m.104794 type:complete len:248 (-) Transcript_32703:66-809(-)
MLGGAALRARPRPPLRRIAWRARREARGAPSQLHGACVDAARASGGQRGALLLRTLGAAPGPPLPPHPQGPPRVHRAVCTRRRARPPARAFRGGLSPLHRRLRPLPPSHLLCLLVDRRRCPWHPDAPLGLPPPVDRSFRRAARLPRLSPPALQLLLRQHRLARRAARHREAVPRGSGGGRGEARQGAGPVGGGAGGEGGEGGARGEAGAAVPCVRHQGRGGGRRGGGRGGGGTPLHRRTACVRKIPL